MRRRRPIGGAAGLGGAVLLALALPLGGCLFAGGAAVGGGAGYEYSVKQELDALEREFEAGRISKQEYLDRKQEIRERSFLY